MNLSVIVAAQDAAGTVAACLDSLLAQPDSLEIIVVDASRDGTAALVAAQYPSVKLIERAWPCALPHLLGVGIAAAQGDIIAISEAHCVFDPGWSRAVLAAHQQHAAPIIGGAVEPGAGLRLTDWALYFADYGQFMLPLAYDGELPGENVSFKRALLEATPIDFAANGFWKTFFCQQAERAGHRPLLDPAIIVRYNRAVGLREMLAQRWRHGRCFGAMRPLSPVRRALFALVGLALPGVLAARLVRRVWPKNRLHPVFMRALPLALLAILAWSAGEWWGTFAGSGNSCHYV